MLNALKLSLRKNIFKETNKIISVHYCSVSRNKQNEDQNFIELMNNVDVIKSTGHAILTLKSLVKSGDIKYEDLKSNEHFETFNDLIKAASSQQPVYIMSTLTNLYSLQYPHDSDAVKVLENGLVKFEMDVGKLLVINNFLDRLPKTDSRIKVLGKVRQHIVEQSSKITSMADIVMSYKNCTNFSVSLLEGLDDVIQKNCYSYNINALVSIVVALSQSKRRNPTLLHTLTDSIFTNHELLSPKNIVNVFYAFCRLNYLDKDLLNKLASSFVDQIVTVKNPSQIGALLFSVRQIRYRHEKLLNALCTWIEINHDLCRVQDFSSYLMTLSIVNYMPSNFSHVVRLILPKLTLAWKEDSSLWINCVWSLVILKEANEKMIAEILKKSVYDSLPKPIESNIGIYFKLLNINSAAKDMECEQFLDEDTIKEIVVAGRKCNPIQSINGINVFENFYTTGKVAGNVLTPMGFPIAAEFILDSKGNPLLLENYSDKGESPFSQGERKIAAMFWNFNHYIYDSSDLIGPAILYKNLLKNNGYTVLEICCGELERKNTTVEHVKIVTNKIKNL